MIDLRLEARPEAVGRARHAIDRLAGRLPGGILDDLRLMVSELVTNCLRHGGLAPGDPIQVIVDAGDRRVRVEVVSPGDGFRPPDLKPTFYSTSGWGLFLVSRLADRWGVDGRDGTRVWLEVDHPLQDRRIRAG
ncbi:MAG TPA: ATP-binding protein [Actinomycetota bacterium]|jgi:anti-sigma regulatory factor (Ser/Thr protein kinase)|nr:ATP-binding protein [Actinomycetota bacterium]